MGNLVFISASDGNNAALAREVETFALALGHTVEHVSLNEYDFPVYTVTREKATPVLEGINRLIEVLERGDAWFVFAPVGFVVTAVALVVTPLVGFHSNVPPFLIVAISIVP